MSPPESSAAGPVAEPTPPATPQATPEPTARKAEERVSIRKRKAIKFGRKIARLRIGRTRETFAIHEELLCSHSPYFREKLQNGRKAIEGECPICHEEMDSTRKEITFCAPGCGANMHYECMKSWKEQKSARREAVTCPLCRYLCPTEMHEQSLHCPELDAVSFEYYQEWLYHHTILMGSEEGSLEPNNATEEDHCALVGAYILGVQVQDRTFRKKVLQALTEVDRETGLSPGPGPIKKAYRGTEEQSPLRVFLVNHYVVNARPGWFAEGDWGHYPARFMADLTMALLRKMPQNQDNEAADEDQESIASSLD